MENNDSATNTSKVIREARKRKYKTAKDFWSEHEDTLAVSYPHYSNIETGIKLPDIELAISISKILHIDLRLICHLWAKDHMPNPETRAFFEPIPGRENNGVPATISAGLDDFYIFTEKQVMFLEEYPITWDVLSFIMSFCLLTPPTETQIAKFFNHDLSEIKKVIEWLRNESLVSSEGGKLKTRRKFFHLPNTEPFKKIRDNNFIKVSADIVKKISSEDLQNKEAYRTTYIRRITRVQANEISKKIDDLIGFIGNMPDTGHEYYAITVALGPRGKFGKQDT